MPFYRSCACPEIPLQRGRAVYSFRGRAGGGSASPAPALGLPGTSPSSPRGSRQKDGHPHLPKHCQHHGSLGLFFFPFFLVLQHRKNLRGKAGERSLRWRGASLDQRALRRKAVSSAPLCTLPPLLTPPRAGGGCPEPPAHPADPPVSPPGDRTGQTRALSPLVPRAGPGGAEGKGVTAVPGRERGVEGTPGPARRDQERTGTPPIRLLLPPPRAGGVDVTLTDGRQREKVILNDFEGLQEERTRASPDSSWGRGRCVHFSKGTAAGESLQKGRENIFALFVSETFCAPREKGSPDGEKCV